MKTLFDPILNRDQNGDFSLKKPNIWHFALIFDRNPFKTRKRSGIFREKCIFRRHLIYK